MSCQFITVFPMMKFLLVAVSLHLALGSPVPEPQCIEGYQESGKSHVVGAYSARRDLSLEGCKELCMSVEEGDECVAIDYNVAEEPFEGFRCYLHNQTILDKNPQEENPVVLHFRRCQMDDCENNMCGPRLDAAEIIGYYTDGTSYDNRDITTHSFIFDGTFYPAGEVCGMRANVRSGYDYEDLVTVWVSVFKYHNDKVTRGAFFGKMYRAADGPVESYIDDPNSSTKLYHFGPPVIRTDSHLQVTVYGKQGYGYGLAYTTGREDCEKSYTIAVRRGDSDADFNTDGMEGWVEDTDCKTFDLQLIYCSDSTD